MKSGSCARSPRVPALGVGASLAALVASQRVLGGRPCGCPHGIGVGASPPSMNGFGAAALAGGDLRHRAAGGDRAVLVQHRVAIAVARILVAVLDQQPVGSLAAGAIVLHPHQHPAAVQPLAVEREFEVALRPAPARRHAAFGLPVAAVPELHRAAAILALGDGALEVAIVERMILDLHRQPLVVRGRARALG